MKVPKIIAEAEKRNISVGKVPIDLWRDYLSDLAENCPREDLDLLERWIGYERQR